MDNNENEVLKLQKEKKGKKYCNNNISIYSCIITRNYIRSIYSK